VKCKVIAPLCGGMDNFTASDIAWTGGNPYDSTINDPAVNGCYHPIEPDKIRKAEHKCVQPLAKARRLKMLTAKVRQKYVPLTQWMVDVEAHLMTNGMDRVFYYLDSKTSTVMNLLDQWSKVTITKVTNFMLNEPWDGYDYDNLCLSGKFIPN